MTENEKFIEDLSQAYIENADLDSKLAEELNHLSNEALKTELNESK